MKKVLFFACMILSYSTVSFSGTAYYCTVNEKFPGMVGVYKEEMEDFILLQAVDKKLSTKELKKMRITEKNDSDSHNQLACLLVKEKGNFSKKSLQIIK
ncbi:MAG: hypothetical protein IPK04_21725 [Bdellovibrionales bacterium]|nr:hypothetical protein [Bdellovibrionales bacterium]